MRRAGKTATTIADLLLRQSAEQNEILKTIEAEGPDDFIETRAMIAATMGAIYLDALRPIYAAHPSLKPPGLD